MADAPTFINTDAQAILQDILNDFQTSTGKVLQPAQVERLLLDVLAYREVLVREAIQYSATQNLVSFADGISLDFLAELVGVERLSASPALCTLEFTLIDGHGGSVIPANTRVSSVDNKVIFQTLADVVVPAVDTSVEIDAECTVAGVIGNGYVAGAVSNLLDPLGYVSEVQNTEETDGGNPQETDDQLRERIRLAPSQFSNAGSIGAYKFFAMSANPSIIDVAVLSETPGTVQIYPLMEDGEATPSEVLDQVLAACNDEKVRPLNDEVTALTPVIVEYDLEIELVVYADADADATLAAVQEAVDAFVLAKRQSLDQNVPSSQVIATCMLSGVFTATPIGFTSVEVGENEVGICQTILISVTGTQDE